MSILKNKLTKKIFKQIKLLQFKWSYQKYLKKNPELASSGFLDKRADSELDIITIAFNNAKMIERQIQLIKKYLTDPHTHIIADNSTNDQIKDEIREICKKNDIIYIAIPFIRLKPSWSHAAALHWSLRNIILRRNSKYFGFIDHDIFPVEKSSVIDKICNGVYGRVVPPYGTAELSENQPYWSLWGGFMFFEYSLFKNLNPDEINFFPKVIRQNLIMDTVGGLWDPIFSKITRPNLGSLLHYQEVKINEDYKNIQSDAYEKLDEWLHIVNLSNWYGSEDMKKKLDFIDRYLKDCLDA